MGVEFGVGWMQADLAKLIGRGFEELGCLKNREHGIHGWGNCGAYILG